MHKRAPLHDGICRALTASERAKLESAGVMWMVPTAEAELVTEAHRRNPFGAAGSPSVKAARDEVLSYGADLPYGMMSQIAAKYGVALKSVSSAVKRHHAALAIEAREARKAAQAAKDSAKNERAKAARLAKSSAAGKARYVIQPSQLGRHVA
jgi:hypothetical protein